MTRTNNEKLISEAIAMGKKGIEAKQSPFGAVIARPDGEIIFAAHNTVRLTCDATAHAEVNAIRGACAQLSTIDLSGHLMATTCEPCPMCAAAIHWVRLDAVLYGATIADAEDAGFNELPVACRLLYDIGGSRVRIESGILRDECKDLFRLWKEGPNPTPY